MRRTLVLLRHGKAESFGIVPEDYQRTLVPEGVRDAKYTGTALRKAGIKPGLYLASAAPRALYTLRFVAAELGADPELVIGDRALYAAHREDLLRTIRQFPDPVSCAVLCGHNPEISDLIPLLIGDQPGLAFLNTSDAAVIDFEGAWEQIGTVPAILRQTISRPHRRIS